MATVTDHMNSARRNEEFLDFLRRHADYPEWAVTVVFYIAVHYGRALLAAANKQVTTHKTFEAEFLRHFADSSCYQHLQILKERSERARYDNVRFQWADVDGLVERRLKPFEHRVREIAHSYGFRL